jgi:uncharacterized protein YqcC (DUF446 family)
MMDAITTKYGQGRVLNVWVGDDPAAAKFLNEKPGMDIWHLSGGQDVAIPRMYDVIHAASAKPQRLAA